MAGTSYGAWLTVMGMLDPHPALKAAVPQASPADMWLGDDFHHNGAFRLSYGFEYAYMMESSKEITDPGTSSIAYDRTSGISSRAAVECEREANSTTNCRRGTISSTIPTTTRSGSDRVSRRG